jgi:hypothetical protein
MSGIVIRDWKPLRRNALLGFVKVEFPSGMIISDVTILTSERGAWASPPSKPQVTKEGVQMKDANGKAKFTPIIEFRDKATRELWSNSIIAALRRAHPEALA